MALKIKLVKSLNGRGEKQIATAHSLGLHKIGNETIQPLLGSLLVRGIWPPSKPGLTPPPERAFWPLWPLPAVLPLPEPLPRPLRKAFLTEPGAGESS